MSSRPSEAGRTSGEMPRRRPIDCPSARPAQLRSSGGSPTTRHATSCGRARRRRSGARPHSAICWRPLGASPRGDTTLRPSAAPDGPTSRRRTPGRAGSAPPRAEPVPCSPAAPPRRCAPIGGPRRGEHDPSAGRAIQRNQNEPTSSRQSGRVRVSGRGRPATGARLSALHSCGCRVALHAALPTATRLRWLGRTESWPAFRCGCLLSCAVDTRVGPPGAASTSSAMSTSNVRGPICAREPGAPSPATHAWLETVPRGTSTRSRRADHPLRRGRPAPGLGGNHPGPLLTPTQEAVNSSAVSAGVRESTAACMASRDEKRRHRGLRPDDAAAGPVSPKEVLARHGGLVVLVNRARRPDKTANDPGRPRTGPPMGSPAKNVHSMARYPRPKNGVPRPVTLRTTSHAPS